ncbi:MAG: protein kinase family protein [Micromonosporaceae bacterium]|nr:protein kinase family protein [Micromonosporaceae bacterium]
MARPRARPEGGWVTQVDEGPESPPTPGILTVGAPTVGEVLAERYQLEQHISDDAYGRQVWRGIDVVLRRPVAVVLRYPGGQAAVEMLDAAVAASRVVHPNLVDVYDAIDEGTRAYVVREWVDGGSLRDYVAETPLDPDRATTVARAIAGAIAAVHASGSVHGNVHPGTVLIGTDGRIVLSDARAGDSATPDADVRAIGGILYCALTGHWPQREAGPSTLPDAVRDQSEALVAPRQVRGGIPGHLSDLATELLDQQLAPPSADVLAADLARLDSDGDEELFAAGGPLDFQPAYRGGVPIPEPRRPIAGRLAIGVAALLVLAVGGLLLAFQFLPSSTDAGNNTVLPPDAASQAPSVAPVATPKQFPLTGAKVRVVDPVGDGDNNNKAGNVVDNDQTTAWTTSHYHTANFGGLKDGIGLLVDLGSAQNLSQVRAWFTQIGVQVQVYVGNTDPGDKQILQTYTKVTDPDIANLNKIFPVPAGTSARYVLLWITGDLPSDPQASAAMPYQAGVTEIQVFVTG